MESNANDRQKCSLSGAGCGMAGWRRHTNVKFGMASPYQCMAAPYQSAEIWAVDFQENH